MKIKRFFILYYPLTLGGTIFTALILVTVIRGFIYDSPAAVLVGLLGAFILGVFLILSFGTTRSRRREQCSWSFPSPLRNFIKTQKIRIAVPWKKTPLFFRYHFLVTGRIVSGTGVREPVRITGMSGIPGTQQLPFFFKYSGTFSGYSLVQIRDIFGLTKTALTISENHSFPVIPGLLRTIEKDEAESSAGTGEDKLRKLSDNLKYFMREYIPGDRFRDINWKATVRVEELVTRTSPVTNKEIKIIPVIFWNVVDSSFLKKNFFEVSIHLEAAKAWLITFINRLLEDESGFAFDLHAGKDKFRLEHTDDVLKAGELLSKTGFSETVPFTPADMKPGSVVFTTAFDYGLYSKQLPMGSRVMRTVPGNENDADVSIVLRDFEDPLSWLTRDNNIFHYFSRNTGEVNTNADRKLGVAVKNWIL